MSYEIIYGKQFIRLRKTGEVVPMLLAGSNNTYEVAPHGGNGRRSRSWCSMGFYNRNGKISEKPEVILKKLDAELNRTIRRQRKQGNGDKPSDVRDYFGWYTGLSVGGGHCSKTSWSRWRSQFTNGVKNALTVEDLAALGVHPYFTSYGSVGTPSNVLLKTEAEYFAELKKWREWAAAAGTTFSMRFSPLDTDSVLRRIRKR